MFEALENRQLLTVTTQLVPVFGHELLWVTGGDENNNIVISARGNSIDPTDTWGNGTATITLALDGDKLETFEDVLEVYVIGNGGNDKFTVRNSVTMHNVSMPIVIEAGDGNDMINVNRYNGRVHFYGGNGNDWASAANAVVKGMPTRDGTVFDLMGDDGNDVLIGSSQGDHLYGGAGNDIILGNAGDDELWGGIGTNILVGGAGKDTYLEFPVTGLVEVWEPFQGGRDFILGDSQDTIARYFDSRVIEKPTYGFTAFGVKKISPRDLNGLEKG